MALPSKRWEIPAHIKGVPALARTGKGKSAITKAKIAENFQLIFNNLLPLKKLENLWDKLRLNMRIALYFTIHSY